MLDEYDWSKLISVGYLFMSKGAFVSIVQAYQFTLKHVYMLRVFILVLSTAYCCELQILALFNIACW